jgi:hypothetical protein
LGSKAHVVGHLPNKLEALNSNPHTAKIIIIIIIIIVHYSVLLKPLGFLP